MDSINVSLPGAAKFTGQFLLREKDFHRGCNQKPGSHYPEPSLDQECFRQANEQQVHLPFPTPHFLGEGN
jgi:hypothetical protein